jgi:hypothetical protein
MPSKRQLSRENTQLKEELAQANEISRDALTTAKLGAFALMEQMEPGEDEVKEFARKYPQWSINWGMKRISKYDTRLEKTFKRDIGDLKPAYHWDDDILLRFSDPEHFDQGLTDVFRDSSADPTTWFSGTGSINGSVRGFYLGGEMSISVEGEASLTRLDLLRVEAAEQYLQDQGLFEASRELVA